MKKLLLIMMSLTMILVLSSCSVEEEDISNTRVVVAYGGSTTNGYCPSNETIRNIPNGYVIDHSHPYDIVQNKNGYDVVIHCVKRNSIKISK